jgi:hypothetical protein
MISACVFIYRVDGLVKYNLWWQIQYLTNRFRYLVLLTRNVSHFYDPVELLGSSFLSVLQSLHFLLDCIIYVADAGYHSVVFIIFIHEYITRVPH